MLGARRSVLGAPCRSWLPPARSAAPCWLASASAPPFAPPRSAVAGSSEQSPAGASRPRGPGGAEPGCFLRASALFAQRGGVFRSRPQRSRETRGPRVGTAGALGGRPAPVPAAASSAPLSPAASRWGLRGLQPAPGIVGAPGSGPCPAQGRRRRPCGARTSQPPPTPTPAALRPGREPPARVAARTRPVSPPRRAFASGDRFSAAAPPAAERGFSRPAPPLGPRWHLSSPADRALSRCSFPPVTDRLSGWRLRGARSPSRSRRARALPFPARTATSPPPPTPDLRTGTAGAAGLGLGGSGSRRPRRLLPFSKCGARDVLVAASRVRSVHSWYKSGKPAKDISQPQQIPIREIKGFATPATP